MSSLQEKIDSLKKNLKDFKFDINYEFKIQSISYLLKNGFISAKAGEDLKKMEAGMGYLTNWFSPLRVVTIKSKTDVKDIRSRWGHYDYVKDGLVKQQKVFSSTYRARDIKEVKQEQKGGQASSVRFVSCGDGKFCKQVISNGLVLKPRG